MDYKLAEAGLALLKKLVPAADLEAIACDVAAHPRGFLIRVQLSSVSMTQLVELVGWAALNGELLVVVGGAGGVVATWPSIANFC